MGQALGLLHRRLDLVEAEVVGHLVDEVDDVVEVADEPQDVLAVDRRDERRVQPLVDVVRDPVALLLADHDVAREVGPVGIVGEHLIQEVGAAHDVGRGLLEEIEEDAVLAGEDLGQAGHAGGQGSCESGVNAWRSPRRERSPAARHASWSRGAEDGGLLGYAAALRSVRRPSRAVSRRARKSTMLSVRPNTATESTIATQAPRGVARDRVAGEPAGARRDRAAGRRDDRSRGDPVESVALRGAQEDHRLNDGPEQLADADPPHLAGRGDQRDRARHDDDRAEPGRP